MTDSVALFRPLRVSNWSSEPEWTTSDNSLEAVLIKICVEERGWNNEGDGVSAYLNSIKDKGLFDPNEAMFAEWEQIINGLQIGVQRTGGDRKRHETFDQDYSILLLHQVGAFLTFVINRYEDQYPN
ncbi:hypothetical protein KM295_15730 [Natronomonas sp. F2-12]|uniref:Uncharacterized protein n=1 Tax=Natronomonas aquatica TaxID=2841590 RepID=A0A9R1D6Y4_9EURY|nr:hypothetical protein [Natronomonas aquatica]MCQ4334901.1 hypothetical protein [Natronomonas aquatica]